MYLEKKKASSELSELVLIYEIDDRVSKQKPNVTLSLYGYTVQ